MLASPTIKPMYAALDYSSHIQVETLPRIRSNTSAHKMINQQSAGPNNNKGGPDTIRHTSGRVGSSTANTYGHGSNLGGYNPIDPRMINGGGA